MTIDGVEYVALKTALYSKPRLFPDVRLRDTRHVFSRIVRRRSRGGFMIKYVSADEVAALAQMLDEARAKADGDHNP